MAKSLVKAFREIKLAPIAIPSLRKDDESSKSRRSAAGFANF